MEADVEMSGDNSLSGLGVPEGRLPEGMAGSRQAPGWMRPGVHDGLGKSYLGLGLQEGLLYGFMPPLFLFGGR